MIVASFINFPQAQDLINLLPVMKAVLFDMDGTLINSEPEHVIAVKELLKKYHLILPTISPSEEKKIQKTVLGHPDPDIFKTLKNYFPQWNLTLESFLAEKEMMLEKLITSSSNIMTPMYSVLENLKMNLPDLKIGLVTASEKKSALQLLARYCPFPFDVTVTRDDVFPSKPHPKPYQFAMEQLGVAVESVLIVEDSPTGLASALASGAKVMEARWFR